MLITGALSFLPSLPAAGNEAAAGRDHTRRGPAARAAGSGGESPGPSRAAVLQGELISRFAPGTDGMDRYLALGRVGPAYRPPSALYVDIHV